MRAHFAGHSQRFECEYRVRRPNGSWHWLLARGRCLFDPAGEPAPLCRFRDRHHRAEAVSAGQGETRIATAAIAEMEAIGTLAGGIAHDFNNILGAILGYSELAVQRSAENSDLRRYLDNVMHATERAKKLVERILAFSRSGMGNQVQFNAQAVVAETLELLQASLPGGIQLRKNLAADTAAVTGDPTDLHQITMNLCTNAFQAMPGGGVLEVALLRAASCPSSAILARGSLSPGSLRTPHRQRHRKQASRRQSWNASSTRSSLPKGSAKGTGLGLSLVHGIVHDLGGAIDVGVDARVKVRDSTLWLPVAAEMPMPTREPSQTLPLGRVRP